MNDIVNVSEGLDIYNKTNLSSETTFNDGIELSLPSSGGTDFTNLVNILLTNDENHDVVITNTTPGSVPLKTIFEKTTGLVTNNGGDIKVFASESSDLSSLADYIFTDANSLAFENNELTFNIQEKGTTTYNGRTTTVTVPDIFVNATSFNDIVTLALSTQNKVTCSLILSNTTAIDSSLVFANNTGSYNFYSLYAKTLEKGVSFVKHDISIIEPIGDWDSLSQDDKTTYRNIFNSFSAIELYNNGTTIENYSPPSG